MLITGMPKAEKGVIICQMFVWAMQNAPCVILGQRVSHYNTYFKEHFVHGMKEIVVKILSTPHPKMSCILLTQKELLDLVPVHFCATFLCIDEKWREILNMECVISLKHGS